MPELSDQQKKLHVVLGRGSGRTAKAGTGNTSGGHGEVTGSESVLTRNGAKRKRRMQPLYSRRRQAAPTQLNPPANKFDWPPQALLPGEWTATWHLTGPPEQEICYYHSWREDSHQSFLLPPKVNPEGAYTKLTPRKHSSILSRQQQHQPATTLSVASLTDNRHSPTNLHSKINPLLF